MKRRVPLRRLTPLARVSRIRAGQLSRYHDRRLRFLLEHPYCQLWLAEHGVQEDFAIAERGVLRFGPGLPRVFVPRSQTVHHRDKRRRGRLLDERLWMAVSWAGHRQIENHKDWARRRGHLLPF